MFNGENQGTVRVWIRCNRSLPYKKDIVSTVSYHSYLPTKGYRALIYRFDHTLYALYVILFEATPKRQNSKWNVLSRSSILVASWEPKINKIKLASRIQTVLLPCISMLQRWSWSFSSLLGNPMVDQVSEFVYCSWVEAMAGRSSSCWVCLWLCRFVYNEEFYYNL